MPRFAKMKKNSQFSKAPETPFYHHPDFVFIFSLKSTHYFRRRGRIFGTYFACLSVFYPEMLKESS
jgi:hypothetical protein